MSTYRVVAFCIYSISVLHLIANRCDKLVELVPPADERKRGVYVRTYTHICRKL